MADINKLTGRIIGEANIAVEEIISEANNKISKIEAQAASQAELKFKSIVEKGQKEAEGLKERLRSNANLKARDNELKVKQEVIQRVFESTLEDLKNIDSGKYIEYIKANANISESELVVMENKLDVVLKELPNAKVVRDRFADTGFIEISGGIEKNYTFSTQLEYIKDDLQGEIAKVLFK